MDNLIIKIKIIRKEVKRMGKRVYSSLAITVVAFEVEDIVKTSGVFESGGTNREFYDYDVGWW